MGIYKKAPSKKKVYEPKGQEGNTIEYSYDGTDANKKQWLIIGDDQNGTINIISPEALGEGEGLKLGTSNNEDECIKDYNKAIEKINTYCDDLITNNKCSIDGEEYTVTGVRSVGMATDEVEEKIKTDYLKNTFEGKFYDALKKSDIKYADDYIKMLYWNITIVGKEYWIASRLNQLGGSGGGYANIRYVNTGDGLDQDIIISLSGTDYRKAFESTRFVRPIITLKKN